MFQVLSTEKICVFTVLAKRPKTCDFRHEILIDNGLELMNVCRYASAEDPKGELTCWYDYVPNPGGKYGTEVPLEDTMQECRPLHIHLLSFSASYVQ